MGSQAAGTIAILGSGPAGLMAAHRACEAGYKVRVFEKRKGLGRKLLVAGSSGLNITYECALDDFVAHYVGPRERFAKALGEFGPEAWRAFIEKDLGIPTFKGTSRRWFVESEGMKASGLLKAWVARLEKRGTVFESGRECVGFEVVRGKGSGGKRAAGLGVDSGDSALSDSVELRFADGGTERVAAACFSLGGGSWEPQEQPLRWPGIFVAKGLKFHEFESSNVGFRVAWPEALLKEAEGKPIKNVVLLSPRGERSGDLVITKYGIEGTPVYFAGLVGTVHLDLKPDLTKEQILAKLRLLKENLSPLRRVKRLLKLSDGALALLFHMTPQGILSDLDALVARIKEFPLDLVGKQPLSEAISSSGGLDWSEVDGSLMLRAYPGVFVAGEMLDWDAPTGGFLIQGCVSLGSFAGRGMARYLGERAHFTE